MNPHSRLVILANEAIENVFSDTSVSRETTLESLEDIAVELELKIETLRQEIEQEGNRQ